MSLISNFPPIVKKINQRLMNNQDLRIIRSSGFYDENWYCKANPDVVNANIDPLLHFFYYGGLEGRAPSPKFNSSWYLNKYEDAKRSGINPLLHYLKYGREEGHIPNNECALLTICINTYNHEECIARALDSVIEQDTTYPYKIWICEDCSTDDTLEICKDYVKKYPGKIELFAQPVNTRSDPHKTFHLNTAIKSITTKYFSVLDGDDAWCDNKKIQIALDFLESNPAYVTFAHDTTYNDIKNGIRKSLVHEVLGVEINNPVIFETAPYLHTSARIFRNTVKLYKHTRFSDFYIYYIHLDKGPLFYYDKIMSIYNITGKGVWSSLPDISQAKRWVILQGRLNKYFNYKYNEFFTNRAGKIKSLDVYKRILGPKLAWELWLRLNSY